MILSKVVGNVVAPHKHPSHEAIKLLLVRQIDRNGEEQGLPFVAADVLGAGVGDRVLLTLNGWAAMTAVNRANAPIDAAVIAVVDTIDWYEDELGRAASSTSAAGTMTSDAASQPSVVRSGRAGAGARVRQGRSRPSSSRRVSRRPDRS